VLVKLGGSLLTDKGRAETARPEVIRRLAEEIARARPRMTERLVLGHGSGSFGHVSADRHGIAAGLDGPHQLPGVAETQASAARLHGLVLEALLRAGLAPFSLSPSSFLVARRGRPHRLFPDPLLNALQAGLLPVTYGDVVMDDGQGAAIASTETVFLGLAEALRRHRLAVTRALWLGDTDGIYDARGRPVREITPTGFPRLLASLGGASGTDVTGGMRHRVETALRLARLGVESWILDGRQPGGLEGALLGQAVAGTRVAAHGQPGTSDSVTRSPR
jgi:isopentenyl phosphate kinase